MQDVESNKDLNLIHLWDISKKNLVDKYFTNITKTRGVITTQTGIDHIYVDSEQANLCMDFATYEVLEVTSHKLLFTRIKDVWIRPVLLVRFQNLFTAFYLVIFLIAIYVILMKLWKRLYWK